MKAKILLVDDDPRARRLLEVSLRRAGFEVCGATSGTDALERLAWFEPDVVVCDTAMPELDGFGFLAALRQDPSRAKIPFVFLVREAEIEDRLRAVEMGAEDFIPRPPRAQEVVTRVRLLLARGVYRRLERAPPGTAQDGSLDDLGVADVVTALHAGRRSGVLRLLRPGQEAVVWLDSGRVVDAICGAASGERAFHRVLLWNRGAYSFAPAPPPAIRRIEIGTQALLQEGLRRIDEWERLRGELPGLDTVCELDFRRLTDKLPGIPDEVNGILRLFDGHRTLLRVVEDGDFEDLTALDVIARLFAEGVIREAGPPQGYRGSSEPGIEAWLAGNVGMTPASRRGAAPSVDEHGPQPGESSDPAPVQGHPVSGFAPPGEAVAPVDESRAAAAQGSPPAAPEAPRRPENAPNAAAPDLAAAATVAEVGDPPSNVTAHAGPEPTSPAATGESEPPGSGSVGDSPAAPPAEAAPVVVERAREHVRSESPAQAAADALARAMAKARSSAVTTVVEELGSEEPAPSVGEAEAPPPEAQALPAPLEAEPEPTLLDLQRPSSIVASGKTAEPDAMAVAAMATPAASGGRDRGQAERAELSPPHPQIAPAPGVPGTPEDEWFSRAHATIVEPRPHQLSVADDLVGEQRPKRSRWAYGAALLFALGVVAAVVVYFATRDPAPRAAPLAPTAGALASRGVPPGTLGAVPGPKPPVAAAVRPGAALSAVRPGATAAQPVVAGKAAVPPEVAATSARPALRADPREPVTAKAPSPQPKSATAAAAPPAVPAVRRRSTPPSVRTLLRRGRRALRRKRFRAALADFKAAVRREPGNASAHYGVGLALYDAGKEIAAAPHLEKAARLQPGLAAVYVRLGSVYQAQGKIAQARKAYRLYLKKAPRGRHAADVRSVLKGL